MSESYDMSSVNSTPQNKTFKSTFGQPTESNANLKTRRLNRHLDNHQHHRQDLKITGFKSTFEQRPEQNSETPREYYDVELPRSNKRKKRQEESFYCNYLRQLQQCLY